MKKLISLLLATVMLVACFAGCGSSGDSTVIKIGCIGPFTGDAATYGLAVQYGAQIAIDEINATADVKYEIEFEDDENDPEKSVYAYNMLKDWGLQIMLGPVTTKPAIAVATESFADRVFALTPSASSTDVTKGKDNMYQLCFSDPNQGTASAQYIKEQKLGDKIAIIYNNADPYSTGIYTTFKSEADKLGLNIVDVSTFSSDDNTDFGVQLQSAQDKGADLIFLPIYYTPASSILKQADARNYHPKFFGVDGMDGILTIKGFDTKLAEGVMLLTPFSADAEDEKTHNFVKKYKEKHGEVPNQFAADAYDCVYAIHSACQKAGVTPDMTAEAINDLLVSTFSSSEFTFDGITGENMKWSKNGEVSKAPYAVIIKDGAYVGM